MVDVGEFDLWVFFGVEEEGVGGWFDWCEGVYGLFVGCVGVGVGDEVGDGGYEGWRGGGEGDIGGE